MWVVKVSGFGSREGFGVVMRECSPVAGRWAGRLGPGCWHITSTGSGVVWASSLNELATGEVRLYVPRGGCATPFRVAEATSRQVSGPRGKLMGSQMVP